jgi:hypothetical protein
VGARIQSDGVLESWTAEYGEFGIVTHRVEDFRYTLGFFVGSFMNVMFRMDATMYLNGAKSGEDNAANALPF